MSGVFAILVFVVVIGGLILLGVSLWRRHENRDAGEGLDLIPYLILALAVGVTGFSLARLARASMDSYRLVGRPSTEIAVALAGIVVAAPLAFFLWRRQASRRRKDPDVPGWPIYLMLIEGIFSIAFFVAAAQVADSLASGSWAGSDWPNLVVYGAIVGFHWHAGHQEPPPGEVGELPRLIGSGVALVALAVGAYGLLHWLLGQGYDALTGGSGLVFVDPGFPAAALGLTLTALPTWAHRWLPAWKRPPGIFRSIYIALASVSSLNAALGAAVTVVANGIAYPLDASGPADRYFGFLPTALGIGVIGAASWAHHQRKLGPGRASSTRTYQYAMAATGLGVLVGAATGLAVAAFNTRLIGGNPGRTLVALGLSALTAYGVWMWFWRQAQAAPRAEEVGTLQRRIYLIGMTIVTGLTAAGALIGTLVVLFRALLGAGDSIAESLRIPLALTIFSGGAFWHLFLQIRADGAMRPRSAVGPFTVTIICSHPGRLATLFPGEARLQVIYRGDDAGVVSDEMAAVIADEIGTTSSVVWVDGDGYRVAPLRAR